MNKDREISALAKTLIILTREMIENQTFAIKDAFRYLHREVVTERLASKRAYEEFFQMTGKDIRDYDWYGGKIKTFSGETISINKLYTLDHVQTGKNFKDDLILAYKENRLTEDFVKERLMKQSLCWITKEEDKKLTQLGYKSDRADPLKAYADADIEFVSVAKTITAKKNNKKGERRVRMTLKENIAEEFTFTSEERCGFGIKEGFRAYNNKGEDIGFVFMTNDKRTPSYGCAELRFYKEYKGRVWLRFTSHGQKIKWIDLKNKILSLGQYRLYID